ncbi:MAG: kelch repeat-containing protein [Anaerotignum sp.]|nr:kelch repeat-containing protein [Anaerotignum sp.]
MPTARWEFVTEVLDGKIYVIGGSKMGTWELISSTEVYDPFTTTWTALASMPIAQADVYGFQTEVVDGKIYVFGVIPDETETRKSITEVYNPSTNTWTILTPMPTPRDGFQTEVIDGKIYAIGGYSGAFIGNPSRVDSLSSAEVYDPSTDTWTTLASMSATRCYHQTEVIDGKIYAICGFGPFGSDNRLLSTEVYDPSTNKWTTVVSMSKKRSHLHTEVIGKVIYAIGGANSTYLESYAVPTSATK